MSKGGCQGPPKKQKRHRAWESKDLSPISFQFRIATSYIWAHYLTSLNLWYHRLKIEMMIIISIWNPKQRTQSSLIGPEHENSNHHLPSDIPPHTKCHRWHKNIFKSEVKLVSMDQIVSLWAK